MRYQRPYGTNDITPEDASGWHFMESTFMDLCHRYCYGELRTPIFEDTDLFIRSVGEGTDIVSKEMYTFEDRGGRSLTLRAEGTAPAIRAYLENHLMEQDPERVVKLFYIAPIFRYDRPQAGRYRQHTQFGVEAIGTENPAVDAEVIHLAMTFFKSVGVEDVTLKLNSVGCPKCAPGYIETLKEAVSERLPEMCEDCQRRYDENPLRMLDCKEEGCQEILADAPRMIDVLCDDCAGHFEQVRGYLDELGIAYELDPDIVRGLDYYTRTAFEFIAPGLGAQSSIGGGGRYDGLIEEMGGEPTPAVGLGIGAERVMLVREALGITEQQRPRRGSYIITLGDRAWDEGVQLLARLRKTGFRVDIDYRRRSMRAQMREADRERFANALIIGENELDEGVVAVRDMKSGDQENVPFEDLPESLKDK
ncbi:MAG: histidine--tRNA ligase [Armatimonadota bacterium]